MFSCCFLRPRQHVKTRLVCRRLESTEKQTEKGEQMRTPFLYARAEAAVLCFELLPPTSISLHLCDFWILESSSKSRAVVSAVA
jgi:hypothetical protein